MTGDGMTGEGKEGGGNAPKERRAPSVSQEIQAVVRAGLDKVSFKAEAADFFSEFGEMVRETFGYIGGLARMTKEFFRNLIKPPFGWVDVVYQCEVIGIKSMPIALLILLFVGLVFAVEFGTTLQTMGAVPFVGKVTSFSIVRELGPVFTSLVVGGRVGAGMAAELGSMVVTEQVDAIRALGANPMKKLIIPRIIASTLMLPLVSLFAALVGIFAGMVISYFQFDLSMVHFYQSVVETVRMTDFATGFFKPFFFGFGIALIGCYEGMNCKDGTVGVGRATTRAVVNIAIMTVVVDFFLGQIAALIPRM